MDRSPRGFPVPLGGLFALLLLSGLFAWWAWQDGAYFPAVVLPGTILLCIGMVMLAILTPVRIDLRLSWPAALALAALVGLAAWTASSALWSPTPDVAIEDGQRVALYAACFAAGLWLCNLLGPWIHLASVPLATAAGVAALAAVLALLTSDSPRELLEYDGTLDYPLGYRNATAGFFSIGLFAALGLASHPRLDWRARGLAAGAATLCVGMFLLCQSRGSVPALALALIAYLFLAPLRLRAVVWLALVAAPALVVLPPSLDLFQASEGSLADVEPQMRAAGAAAAGAAALGTLLGAAGAWFERRRPTLGLAARTSNRLVAATLAALLALGAIVFVAKVGDPVSWLDDRAEEFRSAGTPSFSGESSRFVPSIGSNRYDLWRVAVEEADAAPLHGTGAGGYANAYLRERGSASQEALDAHSVELEQLAELGVPGLALLVLALAGAALGAIRSRRLGPEAAGLSAVALAAGAYWLTHTSVDWFWAYPALTGGVFALLGSACAPAARALGDRASGPSRSMTVALVALAALALSAVPPFLAVKFLDAARLGWTADLDGAYADFDRARALNPLDDEPLLLEGVVAERSGDRERALERFSEAADQRPDAFAAHYFLAALQAETDRAEAREEIRLALELNPLDARVRALARKLGLGSELVPEPEA